MKRLVFLAVVLCSVDVLGVTGAAVRTTGAVTKLKQVCLGAALALNCGLAGCGENTDSTAPHIFTAPPVAAARPVAVKVARNEIVSIGLINTMDDFPASLDGVQLAIDEANAEGGVLGNELRLIVADTGNNTDIAVENVERLITKQKVRALIGPNRSEFAFPIAAFAQAHEVVMVTMAVTDNNITKMGNYIFMAASPDAFQGALIADFSRKTLGAVNASILHHGNDDHSHMLAHYFGVAFERVGGQVFGRYSYPSGEESFATYIDLLKLNKPQVIFLAGYIPAVTRFARQARQDGVTGIFVGSDSWVGDELLPLGGAALDDSYFVGYIPYTDPQLLTEAARDFADAYEGRYGVPPNRYAALGYDATHMIVRAMRRAHYLGKESEHIRAAMAATHTYHGATALIGYDDKRQPTKATPIFAVVDSEVKFSELYTPLFGVASGHEGHNH